MGEPTHILPGFLEVEPDSFKPLAACSDAEVRAYVESLNLSPVEADALTAAIRQYQGR
jgi:hypothetical protein